MFKKDEATALNLLAQEQRSKVHNHYLQLCKTMQSLRATGFTNYS